MKTGVQAFSAMLGVALAHKKNWQTFLTDRIGLSKHSIQKIRGLFGQNKRYSRFMVSANLLTGGIQKLTEKHNDDEERYVHLEDGVPIFSPAMEDPDPHKRKNQESENAYRNAQTRIQFRILLTQIGLVVFGSLGLRLNLWQADTAEYSAVTSDKSVILGQKTERDSRVLAEKQLLESHRSIVATIQQSQLDQRAWVVMRGIGPAPQLDQPWALDALFVNTGKTPAKTVQFSCVVELPEMKNLCSGGE